MEFFKGRFIDTIHKQDIENYRRYLKEMGLVEQTVNKGHVMLSRMFSKLQEYKEAGEVNGMDFRHVQIPDINPCRLVPKVDETKFSRRQTVSEQQWQKLIYYSDDDMKENLIMYLDTGLRPSDVHRLTDYNVDLKNMTLRGVQHKTITTRNPTGVPYVLQMTKRVYSILLDRLAKTKPGACLFPMQNFQKKWQRVREQAGLLHIQRRDLRRTKGTFLLDHGTDARTVADSLGLTTFRLLPTYTPRTLQHQKDGIEKLEKNYEN